jgi:hypothetical protein
MPKVPIDYKHTIIYKIEHIEKDDLVYVGHTTNWDRRKYSHKSCCNNKNDTKHNLKLYTMMRDNGGWDMFRMIEVEKYPCKDKREAEKRECEVMKELKSNMNMVKSFVSEEEKKDCIRIYNKEYFQNHKDMIYEKDKERYSHNKDRFKEYYETKKDKINEKKKIHRQNNKDKIMEYNKQYKKEYCANNKDKIKERKKQYYQANKDRLKEKSILMYQKKKEEKANNL